MELSIEEKAQRYDETINKLRRFMEQGVDPLITRADVQDFFPELKEPEDEKIKKALVKMVSDIDGGFPFEKYGILKKGALTWLAKQGQVKDSPISQHENNTCKENDDSLTSEDDRIRKEIIEHIKDQQSSFISAPDCRDKYEEEENNKYNSWIAWLKKQGEHANFLSKIQVGDKVTRNEDGVLVNLSQLDRVAQKRGEQDKFTKEELECIKDYRGIAIKRLKELEKKGEQKPCMIQWKGNNLKEVIDFAGKSKNFEKWFKSFEEYEKYVVDHNGIFKIFNTDGSHYEIPVGAWIVKTPDGYNVASKAIFKQKSAWSEDDEQYLLVCKNALAKYQTTDKWDACIISHWLENKLKSPKTTWKPSKEQIMALRWVLNHIPYDSHKEEISGLLDQIKDFV